MFKRVIEEDYLTRLSDDQREKILSFSEMTDRQRGFLCGLLRDYVPKKFVEIGASAGGTTALILLYLEQILSETEKNCEFYSVDSSESYYRNRAKRTGFLAEEMNDNTIKHVKFQMLLGKPIPFVIETIGRDIDFLVLDTTHVLPGELLDFLICFPYLNEGAIVVLHDVSENFKLVSHESIATRLLFTAVKGLKFYNYRTDDPREEGMSNIAAFQITNDTKRDIRDVFLGLSFVWSYLPNEGEIEAYERIIDSNYEPEYKEYFRQTIMMEDWMLIKKQRLMEINQKKYLEPFDHWKTLDDVYVYGAGYLAEIYTRFAREKGFKINGYIVSDAEEIRRKEINGIAVKHLGEAQIDKSAWFIIAIDMQGRGDVRVMLSQLGYHNIL